MTSVVRIVGWVVIAIAVYFVVYVGVFVVHELVEESSYGNQK